MDLPKITLDALNESGHKYRKDFVRIPVIALQESTKFMTIRPGVRYKETFFAPDFKAELQKYEVAERQKVKGDFKPRTLETQFLACFFDFDPNAVIRSLLGHQASQAGDGAKNTPSAREVVASVLKNVGASLNLNLFKAKQEEEGNTTATSFDGFDTIVDAEIAAGNISEEKGNLVKLTDKIDNTNAVEVIKKALYKANSSLRKEENFIYCSTAIADAYNDNYLITHTGLVYNDKYEQPYLEGSNKKATFAPLEGKDGSKYIFITQKNNMIVGVDQMSDQERVEFNKYQPKDITGELYMFFGTQFESIDPARLLVIQLPSE